jgi:hypothetical protein
MAQAGGGRRDLRLADGKVAVWANRDGAFLASTDPEASFIVPLHGAAETAVRSALARFGRKTD